MAFSAFCHVIGITLLKYDIELIQENHTLWKESNTHTRMLMHNKAVFQSLDLPENTVLFNVRGRHYVDAMFYTGFPAYNFLPSVGQYEDLKAKNRRIALFKTVNLDIPVYLSNDTAVIIIDKELQGYY